MVTCCKLATKLFAEGKIKPLEVTDLGGIETIEKGLNMLKGRWAALIFAGSSRYVTTTNRMLALFIDGTNPTKLVHTF